MHSATRHWHTILPAGASCAFNTWKACLPLLRLLLLKLVLLSATPAYSETTGAQQSGISDSATQAIKNEAVELISRLHRLEEKLLYPAHTHVAVFLSLAEYNPIDPLSVSLDIDNNVVTNHIYTQREIQALRGGGIQRLYTGNVLLGNHKLRVSLQATQNDGHVRKHDVEYKFNKDMNAEYIEIIVSGNKPHVAVTGGN